MKMEMEPKKLWIESYQDGLYELIDGDAIPELIADGFQFTEGPVWDRKNDRLLFSDIPANTIFEWTPEKGIRTFLKPSRFANGLAFDHNDNLIICEHQGRSISSLDNNNVRKELTGTYAGHLLNSPNDLVITKNGLILFSDPIYGLREGNGGPAQQELPFQGVFSYDPVSSTTTLITDSFERPNGLAFTPDEKHLFIADTVRQHIRVYDVEPDMSFSGGSIWVELWDNEHTGRPDGMKFDCKGNLFTTGPGGIWIFSPDAVLLGRIFLPDKTSNLAWGESDLQSLFITSSDKVYRLRCRTSGPRLEK